MRHIVLLGALIVSAALAAACGDPTNTNQLAGGSSAWDPNTGTPGAGGASSGSSGGASGGTSGSSSGALPDGAAPSPSPSPPAADAGASPEASAGACVPNGIQAILNTQCVSCHTNPPANGSLSPLTNLQELLAPSKENPSSNLAQESALKMNGQGGTVMPPGGSAGSNASSVSAFHAWIASGYTLGCAAGSDAGPPPPPAPAPDVFAGQPAFASGLASQHEHVAGDSRILQDCMNCHGGGVVGVPHWGAAGRLYDGNGNGASGAQVRLARADGAAGTTVYTDALGLFWFEPAAYAPGLFAGARTATAKVQMIGALTNAGCNSCHAAGGAQAPIHVP